MRELRPWLRSLDLEKYAGLFEEHSVDLDIIEHLTDMELKELGIPIGDRKRLRLGIDWLVRNGQVTQSGGFSEAQTAFSPSDGPAREKTVQLRQLTLVFADLVGSTQLSNELDLEQYHDALRAFQKCCLAAIRKHFGYFAQFAGDGVVAYFGYPIAEEDDAERGVLAALEIQRTVGSAWLHSERQLEARVGVATGEVLIDDLARGESSADHIALGEVPNLAARLQTLAKPGQVAISDQTHLRLGSNFSCQYIGSHRLKGFPEPLMVWIVHSARTIELRFEKRQHDQVNPLIGREDELRLLQGRWANACEGNGHAVFLSGEAGLGKSHLADALYESQSESTAISLVFQCSPYHKGSAFFPVQTHLRAAIGMTEEEDPALNDDKISAYVQQFEDPELIPRTSAILTNLLSADTSGLIAAMPPEEVKEQTLETLLRLFTRRSREQPVLMLFEDLHWVDPSTEQLLDRLIGKLDGLQMLLLGTFRPDYAARWGGQSRVTTLSLAGLGSQHCEKLVEQLTQDFQISRELVQKIVERADGVPLFVEELVRMVERRQRMSRTQGISDQDLDLPFNLKDLLRAQIDHLPSTRDIVFVCAALGGSISVDVVAAICDTELEATERHLDILVRSQILTSLGTGGDQWFDFRHALIRDAAYEAMLPRRARILHQKIAETLVSRFPNLADRSPEVVAWHFWKAAAFEPARDKWREAAKIALRSYSAQEAIGHLEASLEANAAAGLAEAGERAEIELREMLNVALEIRFWGSPDIVMNLDRLYELQLKIGTPGDAFLVLHGLCGRHLIGGRPDLAQDYCRQMNELVEGGAEPAIMTLSEHNNGITALFLGDFDDAVMHFDRALGYRQQAEIEQINRYYAADPATIDKVMQCWAKALKDPDVRKIESELEDTIAVIVAEPSDFSRCYSLSILAAIFQALDDAPHALHYATEAQTISRKIKFEYWQAWSGIIIGWAEARSGNGIRGIETLKTGLKDYIKTGSAQIITYANTLLADAYLAAGQPEAAAEVIAQVSAQLETSPVRFHDRLAQLVAARVAALGSN